MPRHTRFTLACGVLLVPMLLGAKGGCGKKIEDAKNNVPDVRGNYAVTHNDQITVTVNIGGAKQTYEGVSGGVIDLGDAQLDLSKACALEGVHCPSEAFWKEVAIDQPFFDAEGKKRNPWLLRIVNLDPTRKEAYMMERGGLVNQHGDFTIGLGLGVAGAGTCGLLAASIATGTFALDADNVATGDIVDGKVTVLYAGGCLLPGEDALVGATITLQSTFTARRIGPFALPQALEDEPIYDEDGNVLDPAE